MHHNMAITTHRFSQDWGIKVAKIEVLSSKLRYRAFTDLARLQLPVDCVALQHRIRVLLPNSWDTRGNYVVPRSGCGNF